MNSEWSTKVGAGTTVNWPVGVGGKGNAGVAAAVKSTASAIGYIELAYVLTNNIAYGLVQNAAGNFVAPSLDGAKADAANVTTIPPDLRFFIVNAPGADSYPSQVSRGSSSISTRAMSIRARQLPICCGGCHMKASSFPLRSAMCHSPLPL